MQGNEAPDAAPVSRRQPARSTRGGKALAYAEDSTSEDDDTSDAGSSDGAEQPGGANVSSQAERMQADEASGGAQTLCWLVSYSCWRRMLCSWVLSQSCTCACSLHRKGRRARTAVTAR